jgi:hypothetical protein
LIHKFEGTLERFVGDGMLVLFNDPIPCADPCLRAARMATAMRAQLAELAVRWRASGHSLGFGVGIAHGYATLGTIGFEGRSDYSAIGTVVNLAARLCAEASDGHILIDANSSSWGECASLSLAAAYAQAGKMDEAKSALAEFRRRERPKVTDRWILQAVPGVLVAGLRKAGLAEE